MQSLQACPVADIPPGIVSASWTPVRHRLSRKTGIASATGNGGRIQNRKPAPYKGRRAST